MSAGKYNILIEQGSDFALPMTQKIKSTGLARDLTGLTITGAIRVNYNDDTPVATFTVTDQDLVNGKFVLRLPKATTAALTFDVGVYNVEMTSVGGFTERIMQGRAVLSRDAS